MHQRNRQSVFKATCVGALAAIVVAWLAPAQADEGHGSNGHGKAATQSTRTSKSDKPANVRLVMPKMDSEKGMRLFASKGCVACHSVNGVGGHDAKALDAHTMDMVMNPFEFAAKMWRMAPAMIAAQEDAMEGQIFFTGKELADIVAFVHDDAQQNKFTEAMIPPTIRKLMNHTHGPKPGHQKSIGHDAKRDKRK